MIKTMEMFTVICDRCKADVSDRTDYSGFDMDVLEDQISEANWITVDDKHYCNNCWIANRSLFMSGYESGKEVRPTLPGGG